MAFDFIGKITNFLAVEQQHLLKLLHFFRRQTGGKAAVAAVHGNWLKDIIKISHN